MNVNFEDNHETYLHKYNTKKEKYKAFHERTKCYKEDVRKEPK